MYLEGIKNILVNTVPVQIQFNRGRNKLFQSALVIGVGCFAESICVPPPQDSPHISYEKRYSCEFFYAAQHVILWYSPWIRPCELLC